MPNELLLQALDRAVLAGKLIPRGVSLIEKMYGNACQVDPKANEVFLNNKPLDEAVAELIAPGAEFDFLIPPKDTSAHDKIEALKAEALSGNVTAHGNLAKEIGTAAYDAWRKANKADPGKSAAPPKDDKLDKIQADLDALRGGNKAPPVDGSNPYKLPVTDATRMAKIAALAGRMPSRALEGMAAAAGCTIDGRARTA